MPRIDDIDLPNVTSDVRELARREERIADERPLSMDALDHIEEADRLVLEALNLLYCKQKDIRGVRRALLRAHGSLNADSVRNRHA